MTAPDSDREESPPPDPVEAELSITGAETGDHSVPVDVLVRSLESLQRIVLLMAGAEEGLSIGDRFAMTDQFREKYALRCGVPRASSYGVPLSLAESPSILGPGDRVPVLTRTRDFLRAAADGAVEELARLLRDPLYRKRVVAEVERMAPRPGDRWALALTVGGLRAYLDSKVYRRLHSLTSPPVTEPLVMTVTGELVRVDFARSFITLLYPPTGREIRCDCDSAVLDSILPSRDDPIQVTGRFKLDSDGHPTKLTKVSRIEPLDLSPMTFESVEYAGRQLAISPPLDLEPTMDPETGQLYILEDEELGIHVFAQTRDQLADELAEQLLFLWDAYGLEAPDRMAPSALALSEALRGRIRENDLATA